MDWDSIAVMAAAAFGVLASWLRVRGVGDKRREKLKADLDVLKQLPEGSDAERVLMAHVGAAVLALVEDESERRRDPLGMTLAATFLLVAGVLLWFAIQRGGGWWALLLPSFLFSVLGAAGLAESGSRRVRDERGRALNRSSREKDE